MTKKTRYRLLPAQGDFLFGMDMDKIAQYESEGKVFTDVCLYQGGVGCVPADTEYLSPTGWKRIESLTTDNELAIYHPNGTISFEKPLKVFQYEADSWYDFDTRFVKQRLCPVHKIVYFAEKDKEMLHPKKVSCADYVKDGCNQHFKIRNYFKSGNNGTSGLSEIELRLAVAYQADGYDYIQTHKRTASAYSVGFHLKKQSKIDRLLNLLNESGINYKHTVRKNGIKKGYSDIFFRLDKIKDLKHFPLEWYSLNDKELQIIFDEVKHWDCATKSKKDGSVGTTTYYTNSKQDRDFIQFVCASQGFCTTTYERTRDIKMQYKNKEYEYKNKREYSVSWTKGKPLTLGKAKEVKARGGDAKYCPLTTTGMWLARYKNYIFVTGNS